MVRYVLLMCSVLTASAATFTLEKLSPPTPGCGNTCALTLTTSGPPPPTSTLTSTANWPVRVLEKQGDAFVPIPFMVTSIAAISSGIGAEQTVIFSFPETILAGRNPRLLKWSIVYLGSGDFQTASYTPPKGSTPANPHPTTFRAPAKNRDEADLYLAGSALFGQGTKPLYMIDAKITLAPPLHWHGVRGGVTADVQTNPGSEPPNDRSEVDPDAIKAAATLNGLTHSLYWELRPAGGEFARKYPASNFVSAGSIAWWPDAKPVPGGWFVLYPSLGTELGANLNKPDKLFKQPVDFSHYDSIRRIVPGIDTAYYVWGTDDNPKVTFNAGYQARILFADEPFTTLDYYTKDDGTRDRAKFGHMRRNVRHWVTAGATWNLNDYFGLTAQYKYGSQPPLFELVQHQITFGIVVKSKLWPKN